MVEEKQKRAPFEAAFTTLPWDGGGRVRLPKLHFKRLKNHATALSIPWPKNFSKELIHALEIFYQANETNYSQTKNDDSLSMTDLTGQPPFLLRLEINELGHISLAGRPNKKTTFEVSGITHPAPNWPKSIQGIKHADWTPYSEAGVAARMAGAHVALLARDGEIIDGDRASPILLDKDGTAWVVAAENGPIPSTTLELVIPAIEDAGIPVRKGKLTEAMFARCHEVLLLGSGLTAARLIDLDGEIIGKDERGGMTTSILQPICQRAINNTGWTDFMDWLKGGDL